MENYFKTLYHGYSSYLPHFIYHLILLLLLLASCLVNDTILAATQAKPLTPDSLRQQLAVGDQITWQQKPLRDGLNNISRSWNVPVFLDRRIDPDQLVDYQGRQTRYELFAGIAAQLGAEISLVDTIVYIGPAATCEVLAAVAETRYDEAQQKGALGRGLRKRGALQWNDGAQPREIIEELAAANKFTIENLDAIPLDVWPAVNWPPIPLTHQLAILLAGFDLTYEISADTKPSSTLRIIELPHQFALRRSYQIGGSARERIEKWKDEFSRAKFELHGKTLTVTASAEDHYQIRRRLSGQGPVNARPPANQEKHYTLTLMNNRFEDVAATIAKSLGLAIEYDPQITAVKDKSIDLMLKDVTQDELLEALVKSVGARYTIEGTTLRIER